MQKFKGLDSVRDVKVVRLCACVRVCVCMRVCVCVSVCVYMCMLCMCMSLCSVLSSCQICPHAYPRDNYFAASFDNGTVQVCIYDIGSIKSIWR